MCIKLICLVLKEFLHYGFILRSHKSDSNYSGVSLTIKRGEFVCIFGTSGGGKTTMLNILGTIDKPTKGELRLCDYRKWFDLQMTNHVVINQNTKDSDLSMLRLTKL